jgi:hypothetical protein
MSSMLEEASFVFLNRLDPARIARPEHALELIDRHGVDIQAAAHGLSLRAG